MKKLLFFAICWCSMTILQAQSYNTALGLRMGTDWGLSAKQRVANKMTVEGILQSSLKREEVMVTALLEKHYPIVIKRFNVYVGGGIHKGWNTEPADIGYENPFGVSFIGGAEFTIARFNISYDFKPAINVTGGESGFYSQSGISVRYVLNKRKIELFDKKKRQKRKKQKAKAKRKKAKQKQKNKKSGGGLFKNF